MAFALFIFALATFTVIIGTCIHRSYCSKSDSQSIDPLDPATVIIAFDIHDVLFKLDYIKIPYAALRSQNFFTLVKHALNPYVMRDVYLLWRNNTVSEKYFIHLTTTYPGLAHCLPVFIKLINTQKPIKPMIALISALKKKGYTLHIFSNIGEQTVADLQQKFPAVFKHFDALHVASAQTNYLGKPHAPAFERYLQTCNPEGKQVLFYRR